MFLNFLIFSATTVLLLLQPTNVCALEKTANITFSEKIKFHIFPENFPSFNLTGSSQLRLNEYGCSPKGKFAIIVHGWLEDCETEWVEYVIWALQEKRGGCIICMDYSHFSKNFNYFFLATQFPDVKQVLVDQLREMDEEGFDFDQGFMFGFSYGGHVVLEAAIDMGHQRFGMIDICERAGPGFNAAKLRDPKLAAKHVQCIHTSNEMGMTERACHEEWSMGNCGNSQLAAGPFPKGSHGLCPYFYHSAFYNDFMAVRKPFGCVSHLEATMPLDGIKMGYGENKSALIGEFFAETSRDVPYNVIQVPSVVIPVRPADEVDEDVDSSTTLITTTEMEESVTTTAEELMTTTEVPATTEFKINLITLIMDANKTVEITENNAMTDNPNSSTFEQMDTTAIESELTNEINS